MPVHMTYKNASATPRRRKPNPGARRKVLSSMPKAFPCCMVQVVEARDEEAALKIAATDDRPTSIPTIYELSGSVRILNKDMQEVGSGADPDRTIRDSVYLVIYP